MTSAEYFGIDSKLQLIHPRFLLGSVETEITALCDDLKLGRPDLNGKHRRGYWNLMGAITEKAASGFGAYLLSEKVTFGGFLDFEIYSKTAADYLGTLSQNERDKELSEVKGNDFYSSHLMASAQAEIIISLAVRRLAVALRDEDPGKTLAAQAKQDNVRLLQRMLEELKMDTNSGFTSGELDRIQGLLYRPITPAPLARNDGT